MGRIVILPDGVANRIAAGEVVQRPASVVKELLDNAIDAAAHDIEIRLQRGGKQRILVRDDGIGMDSEDAVLAFERHATSKIRTVDDLHCIRSLGFRGEALASIAAVSHVILETRPHDADIGTRVEIIGGRLRKVEPVSVPPGTIVQVRNLFMNVPARRKFLAAVSTELAHILRVVENYALAYPTIAFQLWHEQKELLRYPAVQEPAERVRQVVGGTVMDALVPFRWSGEEGQLHGWISVPHAGGSRPDGIHLFVNGRWVRDRFLLQVFRDAWRRFGARQPYPYVIAYLNVDPDRVDVNVHPTKLELRFRDPDRIRSIVFTAIEQALQARRPIVEWVASPGRRQKFPQPPPSHVTLRAPTGSALRPPSAGESSTESGEPAVVPEPVSPAAEPAPSRRVLGQWAGCYIVILEPDALLLIDQHLVHERYLYERWLDALHAQSAIPHRTLLVPVPVDLRPSDVETLIHHRQRLQQLGWHLESFGPSTVVVHAIPIGMHADQIPAAVQALPAWLSESAPEHAEGWDEILKTLACRSAIKKGDLLTPERTHALADMWERLRVPQVCPHGRTLSVRIPIRQVHRMFGRDWNVEASS